MATLDLGHEAYQLVTKFRAVDLLPETSIENKIGDIPFILEIGVKERLSNPWLHKISDLLILKIATVFFVAIIASIASFLGGNFMTYIPLYLALAPVAYSLLKIAYAYFLVKFHKVSLKDFLEHKNG